MIKSLAVLAVIIAATATATPASALSLAVQDELGLLPSPSPQQQTPTPEGATPTDTGIGSEGNVITGMTVNPFPEGSNLTHTTFTVTMYANDTYAASDATINMVLISDLMQTYTKIPGLDQIVTYNQTRDIKAEDFIEYRACSITCSPTLQYHWVINNTDIRAEIPEPTDPENNIWPPFPDARGYDAYIVTATLQPSGDVLEERLGTERR